LLATQRLLEGAAPAGKLETATLRAYAFRAGRDTILALWSPAPRKGINPMVVALEGIRTRAWDLMGNPRGLSSNAKGEVRVPASGEPFYLRAEGITPAALLAAVRLADATRPKDEKAPTGGAADAAKRTGNE
jgi:hypothetical protein